MSDCLYTQISTDWNFLLLAPVMPCHFLLCLFTTFALITEKYQWKAKLNQRSCYVINSKNASNPSHSFLSSVGTGFLFYVSIPRHEEKLKNWKVDSPAPPYENNSWTLLFVTGGYIFICKRYFGVSLFCYSKYWVHSQAVSFSFILVPSPSLHRGFYLIILTVSSILEA